MSHFHIYYPKRKVVLYTIFNWILILLAIALWFTAPIISCIMLMIAMELRIRLTVNDYLKTHTEGS